MVPARRPPLAPPALFFLFLLLAWAPVASAATGSASVEPALAAPGAPLEAILRVQGDPVEVGVLESVACVLRSADGDTPCGDGAGTIDVRVLPGEHAYAFSFAAPAEPGAYEVVLARQGLLGLLSTRVESSAELVVAPLPAGSPAGESLDPTTLPIGGGGDTGGAGPDAGPAGGDALPPGDDARFALSTALGTAVFIVGAVLARRPGGSS